MANGRFSTFPTSFALGLLQLDRQTKQQQAQLQLARQRTQQNAFFQQQRLNLEQRQEQRIEFQQAAQLEAAKARIALEVENMRLEKRAQLGKAAVDLKRNGVGFFPSNVGDDIEKFVGKNSVVTPIPGAGFLVENVNNPQQKLELQKQLADLNDVRERTATRRMRQQKLEAEIEDIRLGREELIKFAPNALDQANNAKKSLTQIAQRKAEALQIELDGLVNPTSVQANELRAKIAEIKSDPLTAFENEDDKKTFRQANELVSSLIELQQRKASRLLKEAGEPGEGEERAPPEQQASFARETGINNILANSENPIPHLARGNLAEARNVERRELTVRPDFVGRVQVAGRKRGESFKASFLVAENGDHYPDPATLQASIRAMEVNPRIRALVPPNWREALQSAGRLKLTRPQQPTTQPTADLAAEQRSSPAVTPEDQPTVGADLDTAQNILSRIADLMEERDKLTVNTPEWVTITEQLANLSDEYQKVAAEQ